MVNFQLFGLFTGGFSIEFSKPLYIIIFHLFVVIFFYLTLYYGALLSWSIYSRYLFGLFPVFFILILKAVSFGLNKKLDNQTDITCPDNVRDNAAKDEAIIDEKTPLDTAIQAQSSDEIALKDQKSINLNDGDSIKDNKASSDVIETPNIDRDESVLTEGEEATPPAEGDPDIQPDPSFEHSPNLYEPPESRWEKFLKFNFDRLILHSLIDPTTSALEIVLAVALSYLSYVTFFHVVTAQNWNGPWSPPFSFKSDYWICLVVSFCNFSLVKSIQPDTASPYHGFNRQLPFIRVLTFLNFSLVFLLCGIFAPAPWYEVKDTLNTTLFTRETFHSINNLIRAKNIPKEDAIYGWVLSDYFPTNQTIHPILNLDKKMGQFYNIDVYPLTLLYYVRISFYYSITIIPVLCMVGLVAQPNTFLNFLFEKIEMKLFGGTCSIGLLSSVVTLVKSIAIFMPGFCIVYFANKKKDGDPFKLNYMLLFIPYVYTVQYFQSRIPNNPRIYIIILKKIKAYLLEVNQRHPKLTQTDEVPFRDKSHLSSRKPRAVDSKKHKIDEFDVHFEKIDSIMMSRLLVDLLTCVVMFSLICLITYFMNQYGTHRTLDIATMTVYWITSIVGFIVHYLYPKLNMPHPWHFLSHPIVTPLFMRKSVGMDIFGPIEIIWLLLKFLEKYILFPAITSLAVITSRDQIMHKYGLEFGSVLLAISSCKMARYLSSNPMQSFMVIFLTLSLQWSGVTESYLVDFFFISILVEKLNEFYLKYVFTRNIFYTSFYAILLFPHNLLHICIVVFSTIFSTIIEPIWAYPFYLPSHQRPYTFFEKREHFGYLDYSTPYHEEVFDKNYLIYNQITHRLQKALAGDISLGRFAGGLVMPGDIFLMQMDNMVWFVQFFEIGSGFLSFKLRGLELVRTACHNFEATQIGKKLHIPHNDLNQVIKPKNYDERILNYRFKKNLNEAYVRIARTFYYYVLPVFKMIEIQLSNWKEVTNPYVIIGHSMSDMNLVSSLQITDYAKAFERYFTSAIVFYAFRSEMCGHLLGVADKISTGDSNPEDHPDLKDNKLAQEYFKLLVSSIKEKTETEQGDCSEMIDYMMKKDAFPDLEGSKETVVRVCGILTDIGVKLIKIDHLETFMDTAFKMFYEDFSSDHITLLIGPTNAIASKVHVPALRMAFKMFHESFIEDIPSDPESFVTLIEDYERNCVILPESSPDWKQALFDDFPTLLTMRYEVGEFSEAYRLVLVQKKPIACKVIKLNSESVRGLWASQIREQIYSKTKTSERHSIQGHDRTLPNLINSSIDPPVGYPVYVSPILTSFHENHPEFKEIFMNPVKTFKMMKKSFKYETIKNANTSFKTSLENIVSLIEEGH